MKILKNIFYLSIVVMFVFSCSNGYEKQILGKWVLESYDLEDFNNVCKFISENKIEQINEQIAILNEKINSETDQDLREHLIERRQEISQSKLKYGVDSVKNMLELQKQSKIGKIFYTFKSDSIFIAQGDGVTDMPLTKWKIINDSLITYIEGQPLDIYKIKLLDGSQLEMSTEIISDGKKIKSNMVMKKK